MENITKQQRNEIKKRQMVGRALKRAAKFKAQRDIAIDAMTVMNQIIHELTSDEVILERVRTVVAMARKELGQMEIL